MTPWGREIPAPPFDKAARRTRMAFIGFDAGDQSRLGMLADLVEPHLGEVVDDVYGRIQETEELRRMFRSGAAGRRMKKAQKDYLRQAMRGPYDEGYFRSRWHIGYVHSLIQLSPHWYVGVLQLHRQCLYPLVARLFEGEALLSHLLSLDKILTLDSQIILESYCSHSAASMAEPGEHGAYTESAAEAKERFLGHMSHEYRTPLHTILGFAEALRDGLAGPVNEQQRDYLNDIYDSGEALLALIDTALELARGGRLALELKLGHFDATEVLVSVANSVRPIAEQRGLAFAVEIAPELGNIEADERRFRQLVFNLLSNAVKFTERGSVHLSACVEQDSVHVAVRDTGIGIRQSDIERVFERFVRLDDSHATPYAGTGLGLAVTRQLVEAHGGRIWVESRYRRGTTFHVLLPRRHLS